ncbi:MAG: DUF3822 family protein [Bacteroidales bacterium]|nr:DUF3822 family protein [Bacteroidales bacterium]
MTSYLSPYIQESINLNSKYKDNYILAIQYSLDGLSFVIFDTEEQKFICLKHYRFSEKNVNIKSLILELQEREEWKLDDFKSVKILIDNNLNTFVPKDYYQKELEKDYLSMLNIKGETSIKSDSLTNDIINIYTAPSDIDDILSEYNNKINIVHTSSVIIESLVKEFSERIQGMRAFVNVKNNSYELTIINDTNLIFHNYFNFNTKEDFLYFILFTFEQLKIDNESIPLYFMGLIEEKSVLVELCSRYVRNIRFFNRDNNYNYINELDSIPYYYYYILYSSVSCE